MIFSWKGKGGMGTRGVVEGGREGMVKCDMSYIELRQASLGVALYLDDDNKFIYYWETINCVKCILHSYKCISAEPELFFG